MNLSHPALAPDGHVSLLGDNGWPTLGGDRRPAVACGDVGSPGEAGRAEPAGSQVVAELAQEVEWLRRRLLTQPAIEQAKGLLIGFYGVDGDAAFAMLVQWSQHSNTKLRVLAASLVAAATESSGQPSAGLRRFIGTLPTPPSCLSAEKQTN